MSVPVRNPCWASVRMLHASRLEVTHHYSVASFLVLGGVICVLCSLQVETSTCPATTCIFIRCPIRVYQCQMRCSCYMHLLCNMHPCEEPREPSRVCHISINFTCTPAPPPPHSVLFRVRICLFPPFESTPLSPD